MFGTVDSWYYLRRGQQYDYELHEFSQRILQTASHSFRARVHLPSSAEFYKKQRLVVLLIIKNIALSWIHT